MRAEPGTTSGRILSATPTVVEFSSLSPASRAEPKDWSYDSSTSSGSVSRRLALSVSSRVRSSTEAIDDTIRPPGTSSPDTDQPTGLGPASLTVSLKSTRILLRETAVAFSMPGACPSVSVSSCDPTKTPRGSIANVPVAEDVALAGSNQITCSIVPPPVYLSGSIIRTTSSMRSSPYSRAAAGALNLRVRLPGPVTDPATVVDRLSERVCTTSPAPRLLGLSARSSTADAFTVMFAVKPRGMDGSSPCSVSVCVSVPLSAAESMRMVSPPSSAIVLYAPSGAFTRSLYVTTTVLSAVRLADISLGAIPS